MNVKPYLKGLYAGAVAVAGAVAATQADGITGTEWVTIFVAGVVADLGVYYLPYAPTKPTPPA
jgi:hypothetical protein